MMKFFQNMNIFLDIFPKIWCRMCTEKYYKLHWASCKNFARFSCSEQVCLVIKSQISNSGKIFYFEQHQSCWIFGLFCAGGESRLGSSRLIEEAIFQKVFFPKSVSFSNYIFCLKEEMEDGGKDQSKLYHQVISYAKKGGSVLSRDNILKRREIQISSVKNP